MYTLVDAGFCNLSNIYTNNQNFLKICDAKLTSERINDKKLYNKIKKNTQTEHIKQENITVIHCNLRFTINC